MKYTVIIVAGGKGMRMGREIPKQFLPIGGKPILMHTLEVFHRFDEDMEIILVLPESEQGYWTSLCTTYSFDLPHRVVTGGETRFHSVTNGLHAATGDYIAVHDGVRPFVSSEVIGRCFDEVQHAKAVIPVIDVHESIREITSSSQSVAVDRNRYRLVQTPQVFQADLLRNAYQQPFNLLFTDDASVVEAFGTAIQMVEGNRENIKITTPFDLQISSALLG